MHVVQGPVQIANASQVLASLKENRMNLKGILERVAAKSTQGGAALEGALTLQDGAMRKVASPRKFLPPQFANIPEELKKLPRWVLWNAESNGGEKPRKVPYCPTMLNARGSSTDPTTWGTFAQVEAAFDEGGRTGIGFVLNGDGIVGIDIDHCVVDGQPSMAAMELMSKLGVEYVELSPSGTGLRGFGYGDQLTKGVNGTIDGLKVELYSDARYLTVTGCVLRAGPLTSLNGFCDLANAINDGRAGTAVQAKTAGSMEDRHQAWMRQIISGEVYHDNLRDMAGSMIASGMQPGAVVSTLRGLMQVSMAPHDERWKSRFADIPRLVDSALVKFSGQVVDVTRILQSVGADTEGKPLATRFKVLSGAEIAQSAPIAWTIRGLLPKTGLAALYGASGSGKSFLALDMGASIAAGHKEWYGLRVTACPVTYCVLEGEAGIGKRVAAWEAHTQVEVANKLRFIVQPFDIRVAADVQELAVAIRAAGGADGLIVLDTLNRAAPGADENSSKDMGVIIANAKALQQVTGGMVLLVHHTGKDENKGMRGHSSLFAAMDAVIFVSNSKDKGLSWGIAKSKDDATGGLYAFRLEQVVVGIDDEGEDVTSCVAVPLAPPVALRKSKRLGQHQEVALRVLAALVDKTERDSAGVSVDIAVQAVANEVNAGPRHKRQRAKEAIEALVLKQLYVIAGNFISPVAASK